MQFDGGAESRNSAYSFLNIAALPPKSIVCANCNFRDRNRNRKRLRISIGALAAKKICRKFTADK
jgi:hypothetical protein